MPRQAQQENSERDYLKNGTDHEIDQEKNGDSDLE